MVGVSLSLGFAFSTIIAKVMIRAIR
jgi:hypothetical protein